MKNLLLISFIFLYNLTFCQIKSVVVEEKNKTSIPFVNIWIENENIGTTSNQFGEFEIDIDSSAILVFSAIGYETKRIAVDSITNRVTMKAAKTKLKEVVVMASKKDLKRTIGGFKKASINHYFGVGTIPWITARYFPYDSTYHRTRFLDEIKILTKSDVKNAKFNIRLYDVNDKGEPANFIYDKNIIGIAKKGKRINKIDISDLYIEFPNKGLFVAIEWFIIDENLHEFEYTLDGSTKKLKGITYEPAVGTIPAETSENSWVYMKGQWNKVQKNRSTLNNFKNKYSLMAVELILTN